MERSAAFHLGVSPSSRTFRLGCVGPGLRPPASGCPTSSLPKPRRLTSLHGGQGVGPGHSAWSGLVLGMLGGRTWTSGSQATCPDEGHGRGAGGTGRRACSPGGSSMGSRLSRHVWGVQLHPGQGWALSSYVSQGSQDIKKRKITERWCKGLGKVVGQGARNRGWCLLPVGLASQVLSLGVWMAPG